MLKKLLLFFFILAWSFTSFSQDEHTLISGTIIDSLQAVVKNANIINLKTNQGTFSNDNGDFRMFVQLGDSIRVSSVQHQPKIIRINKKNITTKKIVVSLKATVYQLDEFELKRHDLSGILGVDSRNVPRNKKDSLLRKVMDFSNINFKADAPMDYIESMKAPMVNTLPYSFSGVGAAFTMPFKDSARLWALRKELAQKKSFPYVILSELGEKFFFDTLKIPVEKYFHFLEYCNPLGIENLHKDGKLLEVIKILRKESVSYLEILEIKE